MQSLFVCRSKGAQVSSNSWGTLRATTPSRALYDIINAANAAGELLALRTAMLVHQLSPAQAEYIYATSAGHVVVFAAGNDGIDMDNSGGAATEQGFVCCTSIVHFLCFSALAPSLLARPLFGHAADAKVYPAVYADLPNLIR